MRKNNILFVEPRGAKSSILENSIQHPLLGPLYMATQLKQAGYNVKVLKENLVDESNLINELILADILILTLLTTSALRGYEIAQTYRKLHNNDGWIIAGGIHVSCNPEEALPFVDQVVIGEGPPIIKRLVDRRIAGRIVTSSPVEDLNSLPIPDLSLLINYRKLRLIPIMTSLGCPHGCAFCCVTKMYGRKYRFQDPDKTVTELKNHFQLLGRKRVFFYDDNFCANKKISLELFDKIEKNNLNFLWVCQVRADLAKDDAFVKRMADVGCRRVFIGFESINDKTLNDLQKNISLNEIESAIEVFHKYGIAIHGMFILGSDHDDHDVFDNTANFCIQRGIESAQFLSITPFPGTEFWDKLDKSRLIYKSLDELDGFHVTVLPKQMTEHEMMQGILYTHEKMYSWQRIFHQIIRDLKFVLLSKNRSLSYKILKLVNNLKRNFIFRLIIARWKNNHREYHEYLKAKYSQTNKTSSISF